MNQTNAPKPQAASNPTTRAQAFGHIASSVAHSVINHFSAIVSQAEMLKARPPSPEETASRADAVIRAALEGAGLARRLAEYGRAVWSTEPTPLDLDALIAAHVRERRDDAPAGVKLIAELHARAVFPGEPVKLVVMLDCLIDNAFEALADAGRGGSVVVSTRLDDRGWLQLDIRDDGPGMTSDVLEYALEPFHSTRDDHAGLGLPLARSLWRRHRGAFSIDAPQGRGTLVRLTRPPT